jgi:hypothetical protein
LRRNSLEGYAITKIDAVTSMFIAEMFIAQISAEGRLLAIAFAEFKL